MSEFNNYGPILKVDDICEILHISRPTAYNIMSNPDFPLIPNIGKNKRVFKTNFLEYLEITA